MGMGYVIWVYGNCFAFKDWSINNIFHSGHVFLFHDTICIEMG